MLESASVRSRLVLFAALLLFARSAAAVVAIDWVPIGNPGNAADGMVMTCCGNSTNTSGYGDVE